MIKYILFVSVLLLFSNTLFAQLKVQDTTVKNVMQYSNSKTIDKVSAYPNPFSEKSKISFFSNKEQHISFVVKNILGKTIYRNSFIAKPGINESFFYKDNLRSGMYIYTLQTEREVISKRFVIK